MKLNSLIRFNLYIIICYFFLLSITFANSNCSLNVTNNSFYELSHIEINVLNKKKWQKNLAQLLNQKVFGEWNSNELRDAKTKKKYKATIKLIFKNNFICEYSSEIRFHGDGSDHLIFKGGFPVSSMNIMLENGNLNNIVNFILFIPDTRNKDNEIFVSTFLKHIGFLAPETFYTNVKINGQFHKFIFQEKIRKEFLERNKLVEGPIFGGHENFYRYGDFERIARVQNTNWIKYGNNDRLKLAFELLDFLNLLYLKDPKLNNDFKFYDFPFLEIDLDELYKNEIKRISEFDAMMYVLSGYHSLRGDNRRLYYHPILHEFFPIYYDGEVTILNQKVDDFFLDFENNEKRNQYERTHYPIPTYSTTVGISGIKKYLENINSEELYTELKLRGLDISKKNLKFILNRIIERHNRLTSIKIKKPDLKLNQSVYKKYLNNENDRLVYKNKENKKNNFIHCDFYDSNCIEINLDFKDQIKLLKQNYKKKDLIEYQYINSSFEDYKTGNIKRKKLGIKKYKTLNIDKDLNLKHNEYMSVNVDEENKILKVRQLNEKGRLIISNSKIIDWKILLDGSKENKSNKLVEDNLTGCLTIINSRVESLKFFSNWAPCEDAINFINTSGNIAEIFVENSISDAIDADFSDLIFRKVYSSESYNDCLDLSFGSYFLVKGVFKNCGDKALSVGEKSSFKIKEVIIKNSNIGIASKDSSLVKILDADIDSVKYCLSAYNKKQEFYGGEIMVDKLNCKNYFDKTQKDESSDIIIQNNL